MSVKIHITERNTLRLLKEYNIPVIDEGIALNKDEAVRIAAKIGFPVVVKGFGVAFLHKTEKGLVCLNLDDSESVRKAAVSIRKKAGNKLEGFVIQPYVKGKREFAAGMFRDKQFGPIIMFGLGGIFIEAVSDIVFRLAPLTENDASEMLDEELGKWRNRKLGEYPYLILDAHYEKVRINGSVQSCAVFTAIGVNTDGKREILGVSVSLSEAEVHWRAFLKSLLDRGLHGVRLITSDAHSGLKAARQSLFNGVQWQRCQFHLQLNAQAYVPKKAMQKQVHDDIADIFGATNGELAQERMKYYVEKYAVSAPQLSEWMEENLPEGLTVFQMPTKHRKRMRTSNSVERLHEEINRRTRVARLFPNEASLLRLVSAIEMEISEDWVAGKKYLNMQTEMENENESANSKEKRIYRKNVA